MVEHFRTASTPPMGASVPSSAQPSPRINLRPVSGLRAIACLGVLIGHCMFWVAGSAADKLEVYQLLDQHAWMTGLMKMPEVFMDTFLVLTGCLAAQSLLPGLAAAPNILAFTCRQAHNRVNYSPNSYALYSSHAMYTRSAERSVPLSDSSCTGTTLVSSSGSHHLCTAC